MPPQQFQLLASMNRHQQVDVFGRPWNAIRSGRDGPHHHEIDTRRIRCVKDADGKFIEFHEPPGFEGA